MLTKRDRGTKAQRDEGVLFIFEKLENSRILNTVLTCLFVGFDLTLYCEKNYSHIAFDDPYCCKQRYSY